MPVNRTALDVARLKELKEMLIFAFAYTHVARLAHGKESLDLLSMQREGEVYERAVTLARRIPAIQFGIKYGEELNEDQTKFEQKLLDECDTVDKLQVRRRHVVEKGAA